MDSEAPKHIQAAKGDENPLPTQLTGIFPNGFFPLPAGQPFDPAIINLIRMWYGANAADFEGVRRGLEDSALYHIIFCTVMN